MTPQLKTFTNELGNTITVQVAEKPISGVEGILITIEGPSSKTEVHITRQEAEVLLGELRLLERSS